MKIKKYQIIIFLLSLYAVFMAIFFGLDLLKEGNYLRFYLTLGIEALVIVLAYFALKRKDRFKKGREG